MYEVGNEKNSLPPTPRGDLSETAHIGTVVRIIIIIIIIIRYTIL